MYFTTKSKLWKIHGKWYDLTGYMKRHPGGETILKQTQGQGDVSALFETYHAFSDVEKIYESLQKWRVVRDFILLEEGDSDSEEDEEEDEEEEDGDEEEEDAEDDGDEEEEDGDEEEEEEDGDEEEEDGDEDAEDGDEEEEEDGDEEEEDAEEKIPFIQEEKEDKPSTLLFTDSDSESEDDNDDLDKYDLLNEQDSETPEDPEVPELPEEEDEEEEEKEEPKHKWGEFDFTSYRELVKRIKHQFPTRESVKSPTEWYIITLYMTATFIFTFYHAMFMENSFYDTMRFSEYQPHTLLQTSLTIIASISWMSLGFNVMHDASHYAISMNPQINESLSKLYNGLNLWNSKIWFYHHVLHHHSFTGILYRDPDVSHYYPFAIKKREDQSRSIWKITQQNQESVIPFLIFLFPGQHVAQSISYAIAAFRRELWRMNLPNANHTSNFYDPFDMLGVFITLSCFRVAIARGNLAYLILFIVSNNIIYGLNVIFDHDSVENLIINEYEGDNWMKMQVQHSANFMNGDQLWTRIFGSINYQIEHHLFPSMSNYYYPEIQPIVEEYCREKNIHYVHHPTMFDAWCSYISGLTYNKYQYRITMK
jgi:fatty acid desaturase